MVRLILVVFLLFASQFVVAEPVCSENAQASQEECACLKKNPGFSLEACELDVQDNKTKQTDKKLNLAYKRVLNKLGSQRKTELIEAQRLWVRLHVKDCELNVHVLESIGSPIRRNIVYAGCLEEEMGQRIKFLESLSESVDGAQ
jgi:uncharacterized protein YecT (DUF1311 family)